MNDLKTTTTTIERKLKMLKENIADKKIKGIDVSFEKINNGVYILYVKGKMRGYFLVFDSKKKNKLVLQNKYRKFKIDVSDPLRAVIKLLYFLPYAFNDEREIYNQYVKQNKKYFSRRIFLENLEKFLIDKGHQELISRIKFGNIYNLYTVNKGEYVVEFYIGNAEFYFTYRDKYNKIDLQIKDVNKILNEDLNKYIKLLAEFVELYGPYFNKFEI